MLFSFKAPEMNQETIVAQATAPGRGGVGIVRVSGRKVKEVAQQLIGKLPPARFAEYCSFIDEQDQAIDQGIAIYFAGPHSFTGEDVLELQGHGGPVIMDMLIHRILTIPGIRMANPGEFSERAFLNDKMDLTQAEAIADLIDSTSEQAARSAMHSLQGQFSRKINALVDEVIHLRMYVEAAIDFPEEEIDFLSDGEVIGDLKTIINTLADVLDEANQGSIIREGMRVVIAGRPNAGKSSLLNALAGKEAAIVTDIAGTTRDVLTEHIHIDGMPLHIIDTAGLRDNADVVETIGIERAWKEIEQADIILFMVDATTTEDTEPEHIWPDFVHKLPADANLTVIRNKADLSGESISQYEASHDGKHHPVISLAAKSGQGVDLLRTHLKKAMGYKGSTEGGFMARRRHINALKEAQNDLLTGQSQLENHMAGELLAEDLRQAQMHLNEITGEFTSDDLLGKIFSSFCIGK
jgi:tRNA modification GTPase